MPVSISCPKCQTKYSIPDNLQGKPVKCKSCGVTFRTKAPGVAGAGKKADPNAVSQQDLKKYGISGQLTRSPEIFTSAPHQSPPAEVLGNFAMEDPGFADEEAVRRKIEGKKKPLPPVDLSEYSTARLGMKFIFYSGSFLVGFSLLVFTFALIGILMVALGWKPLERVPGEAPGFMIRVVGFLITTFYGFLVSAVPVAVLMLWIGQFLCITAPQRNEKLAAGLVFGCVFASIVLGVIGAILKGLFTTAVASVAEADSEATDVAEAVVGFVDLGLGLGAWLLGLAAVYCFISYYWNLGTNIRSKELLESTKVALITWYTTIIASVIGGIAIGVIIPVLADDRETVSQIVQILSLINAGLGLATMLAALMMIKTAINQTLVKT